MRIQHRLYREAQSDYWEARSRRVLAIRRLARFVIAVAVAAVAIAGAAYGAYRADPRLNIPGFSASLGNGDAGLSSSALPAPGGDGLPKSIVATYQPGDGGSYVVACVDPQGTSGSLSGVLSYADVGGWDCILVNEMSAIIGSSFSGFSGVSDWSSLSDLEPYLAPGSVIRDYAAAEGGTFVSA